MKKKLLLIVMALVLVASCALGLAACNSGDIKGQFELSSDGTYYICTGASWYSHDGDTEVVDNMFEIPSEYDGKPVKQIAEKAFRGSRIGTIIIPNSVNYIGAEAFSGAKGKVVLGDYSEAELTTHDDNIQPYSVYFGEKAFSCQMTEVEIPENAYLDGHVFLNSPIEKVTFKGGISVKVDGSYSFSAFYGCELKSIDLPENEAGYSVYLSGLVDTSPIPVTADGDAFMKTYTLPLEYVVVPANVSLKGDWESRQIQNYDVYPPTIYYKGDILQFKGPSFDSKCTQFGKSEKTFGQFVFFYSEDSRSGNYWHYVNDVPAKW